MTAYNDTHATSEEVEQRAILVGFSRNERFPTYDIEESMEELSELAKAAGATVLGQMVQSRVNPEPATLIGKGKVEEVREMAVNMDANLIIFNDELSGAQLRNLEEMIQQTVLDRTALILDIFASRANSRVAKLQVELAQLRYRLPRLVGLGKSLSRTGGGIGTRGPGEQKLELDRRRINERITEIRRQLKEQVKVRHTQREQRSRSEVPVVAVVGYTNAGKSTLMNKLLEQTQPDTPDRQVFVKNMLFATLDTYSRRIEMADNKSFVLTDTVGFVSKLPHSLVEAFKATLEEVVEADLLVHLVDATNEHYKMQVDVTNQVLEELGALNKPQIVVYNKVDIVDNRELLPKGTDTMQISAVTGEGIDRLIQRINSYIFSDYKRTQLLIPYTEGQVYSHICEVATVLETKYEEDGTWVDAELKEKDYNKYKQYVTEATEV